jgi:hypothetical protein
MLRKQRSRGRGRGEGEGEKRGRGRREEGIWREREEGGRSWRRGEREKK